MERFLTGQKSEAELRRALPALYRRLKAQEIRAVIAFHLVAARIRKDMTQTQLQQLTRRLGPGRVVGRSTIWRLETADAGSWPGLSQLLALSKVLKIDPLSLFCPVDLSIKVTPPASMNDGDLVRSARGPRRQGGRTK